MCFLTYGYSVFSTHILIPEYLEWKYPCGALSYRCGEVVIQPSALRVAW